MAVKEAKEREILERAYRAIINELGIAGFVRFIRLTEGGRGNWTEEKEKELEKLNSMTIKELVDYIKKRSREPREGQEFKPNLGEKQWSLRLSYFLEALTQQRSFIGRRKILKRFTP